MSDSVFDDSVRTGRADSVPEQLDEAKFAIIKGMLLRGDRQSDIAAFFKINSRVISHVNNGRYEDFAHVDPTPTEELPPVDYPSPYELMEAHRGMWKARVALETAIEHLRTGLAAVYKAERQGQVAKVGKK